MVGAGVGAAVLGTTAANVGSGSGAEVDKEDAVGVGPVFSFAGRAVVADEAAAPGLAEALALALGVWLELEALALGVGFELDFPVPLLSELSSSEAADPEGVTVSGRVAPRSDNLSLCWPVAASAAARAAWSTSSWALTSL